MESTLVLLLIKYEPTLSLFSKHATYLVSTRYTVAARFHECFSNPLAALKEAGYSSDYLNGNPTSVTAAYCISLNA
ncbi:hypothetical protein DTO045G8_7196 [Paecilomyces variotii]|nr:hypothetical protein DTO045G8_7196 [Paecilomyces variotii]